MVVKRFPNGAAAEPFFQKRAPSQRPSWAETARIRFPSGRFADLLVCDEPADLLWAVNLGCIDLNPWPVRAVDVDHPDELRVDLDPTPEASFADVKEVALVVKEVLEGLGFSGYPKTSGSRGIHIYVRIEPRWEFGAVRRASLALSREVERRLPELATTAWWKEERHGVFLDYNQNARDRTVASAYSVRPTPDARVSCPVEWSELPQVELGDFTIETVPQRLRERGDPAEAMDGVRFSLEPLLALVAQHEREGLGDAAWPPQFPKAPDEPARVQPSRARRARRARPLDSGAEAEQTDVASGENRPAGRKSESAAQGAGRRQAIHPLITVAKAEHKDDALAELERWKARHRAAAAFLKGDDVLVDSMRGSSSTWTRIRINLRNVPEGERPAEEAPDPDYDPWPSRESDSPPGAPARSRADTEQKDAASGDDRPAARRADEVQKSPQAMRTPYRRPRRSNPADGRL